jgi:Protein kinase domain
MGFQERSTSLTVAGRLIHTRGIAVAALLLLFALVLGGAAVRAALRTGRVVAPGISVDADNRVWIGEPAPDGLRPGDELVRRAGPPGLPGGMAIVLAEIDAGDALEVIVRRGGEEFPATIALAPLASTHAAALWLRVICAILVALLGFVSFVLRPGTRVAWLFFLFCLAVEVVLLFNVVVKGDRPLFVRLMVMSFALDASLGLHLFLEFPRQMTWLARRPWLAVLPYLPALPLIAFGALAPLDAPGWMTVIFASYGWSALTCLMVLGILVAALWRARRGGHSVAARQSATLLLGVAFGLFLPMGFHLVRAIFEVLLDKTWIHVNAAPTLVYPALTAWALLRQNALGADRFTTAVVGYAATVALLGVTCALFLVAVPLLFEGQVSDSPLALVATSVVASLSLVPLYRRIKRVIDRRFLRDRAGDGVMAAALQELMRTAVVGDRERTLDGAMRALGVLQAERIEIWLAPAVEARELVVARSEGEGIPPSAPSRVALDGALVRGLGSERVAGVESFAETALPAEAQAELWRHGLALAAPVPRGGGVAGFVGLGRRVSGSRFDRAEQAFLGVVAAQIGLALERGSEDTHLGRYRLERRLGIGGMAEVFVAWQIGLAGFERRVALKRPLPDLLEDPESIAMFLEEAQLAAQLSHPNIVQIFEVDRYQGQYYIAMEYVEGTSLRTLLRTAATAGLRVPARIAAAILDALLAALAHAHVALDSRGRPLGIVHRDVTPSNILIADTGVVKLVDFGVARSAIRLQKTQTGVVKGTAAYMSPEQSMGREVDARSDLFSAGAVLYECLTGKPPYPEGAPKTTLAPPPIQGPLREVVSRALAYRATDRWADANEMRRALAVEELATTEEIAVWAAELRRGPAPSAEDDRATTTVAESPHARA